MTLSALLESGAVSVRDALRIARGIAAGLSAAHEAGVVHGELSAQAITVGPDGQPRINGLAPGRPNDVGAEVDIRAFGEILWLLLTGHALAPGADPDWSRLPSETPLGARRVLRRTLDRERQRRLREIADALPDLEDEAAPGRPGPGARSPWRWALLAVLGVALAVAGRTLWVEPPSAPLIRLTLPQAGSHRLSMAAISPDGRRLVYPAVGDPVATQPLHLRELGERKSIELPGTRGARNPFFSPDGRSVAFFRDRDLWRLDLAGCAAGPDQGCTAAPTRICSVVVAEGGSGTWSPNGFILLSRAVVGGQGWPGLARVDALGGEPAPVTTVDEAAGDRVHSMPELLPGSGWFLYTVTTPTGYRVEAARLDGAEHRVVLEDATAPRYVPDGHLVVYRPDAGVLQAMPFDARTGRRPAERSPCSRASWPAATAWRPYAVSSTGTLIYSDTNSDPSWRRQVVWVDRQGRTLETLLGEERPWTQPRISPDGRRLVVRTLGVPNCQLWIYDFERSTLTRLNTGGDDHGPAWHPDGQHIAVASSGARTSIRTVDTGRNQVEDTLSEGPEGRREPAWSPDGRHLLFTTAAQQNDDVWVRDISPPSERPLLVSHFNESDAAFSPDGQWIAYTSDATGRSEIYIRPFGRAGSALQVSAEGGRDAVWARDGREIYFLSAERRRLMRVRVEPGPVPTLSAADVLLTTDIAWTRESQPYDVSPDGQRFVVVRQLAADDVRERSMHVVLGWSSELRRVK